MFLSLYIYFHGKILDKTCRAIIFTHNATLDSDIG